jgi:SAM-dependent methyltransferase
MRMRGIDSRYGQSLEKHIMTDAPIELKAFKELEQSGWEAGAPIYDIMVGAFTQQAVDRLLDATQIRETFDVLDVACGPGYGAGRAAALGAKARGIDFAPSMIEEARRNFPQAAFQEGEAEALDFDDASFDAVICNFGLLHMAEPEKAMAEAYRVLRSGGRYAFTVWCGPDRGPSYFSLLFGAIQAHANMDVPLPPAPPLFRFSDADACRQALMAEGFINPQVTDFAVTWRPASAEMLLEFIQKCAVRGRMLIDLQKSEVRDQIYRAIREGAKQFERHGRLEAPWPAVLVTARKP